MRYASIVRDGRLVAYVHVSEDGVVRYPAPTLRPLARGEQVTISMDDPRRSHESTN